MVANETNTRRASRGPCAAPACRRAGHAWPRRRRAAGFTATELLATVAISGILLTVAVPNLGPFVQNRRIATATNDLVHAITRARTEAVKRGMPVIMCRSGDPNDLGDGGFDPECKGTVYGSGVANQRDDWSPGWLMYAAPFGSSSQHDYDKDADTLIAIGPEAPEGVSITSDSDGNNWLTYFADGTLNENGAARYAVCDRRGPSKGKLVVVPLSGRPRVTDTDTCDPS